MTEKKAEKATTLVTFEDYDGNEVAINPAFVAGVSSYTHHEEHLDLPDELLVTNGDGFLEVSADPELKAKANALRQSERTIIRYDGTSIVVKGSVAQVTKALG